jgi:hypothetical protein
MRASIIAALLAGLGPVVLTGPAAAVPAGPGSTVTVPSDVLTPVRMKRHRMRQSRRMMPGASGVRNVTRGAPAGSSTGGNAVTGSTAAPSGR